MLQGRIWGRSPCCCRARTRSLRLGWIVFIISSASASVPLQYFPGQKLSRKNDTTWFWRENASPAWRSYLALRLVVVRCGHLPPGDRRTSHTTLSVTLFQDTLKATVAFNVSCHSFYAPSIHGQTRLLDSMHACLNVDEIVRLIAHELVAANGRATAVCLASCCKGFEDPVLDALWEKQGFLLPLLKTFPVDVWKEGGQIVSAPTT